MKKSSNNIYSCTGLAKVFSFTLSQTFKNRAYRVSYIMFIVLMMVMGRTRIRNDTPAITAM